MCCLLAQAVGVPLARLGGLRYHDINATETSLSGLRMHLINVSLVCLPLTIGALTIWMMLTDGLSQLVGPWIIVANVLQAYAQVPQGRFVRLREFRTAAGFELLRGACSVTGFLIGLWWFDSMAVAAALLVTTWSLVLIGEFLLARRLSQASEAQHASELADIAPIGMVERLRYALSDALTTFQSSSARLFVGALLNEVAVGIFGATALLIRFIQAAALAGSRTLLPELADGLARDDHRVVADQYHRINRVTLALVAVFTGLGYTLTPPLIDLLLGSALRPEPMLAAIIMFGAAPLVGAPFLTQILIALRLRRAVERTSWITLLVGLVVTPPMIVLHGLNGRGNGGGRQLLPALRALHAPGARCHRVARPSRHLGKLHLAHPSAPVRTGGPGVIMNHGSTHLQTGLARQQRRRLLRLLGGTALMPAASALALQEIDIPTDQREIVPGPPAPWEPGGQSTPPPSRREDWPEPVVQCRQRRRHPAGERDHQHRRQGNLGLGRGASSASLRSPACTPRSTSPISPSFT